MVISVLRSSSRSNATHSNGELNNDISLYLGLFEKSPTVLREAIVTTPYSEHDH